MRREDYRGRGPRWRVILEAQWRDQVQEVTELSLAYYGAADTAGGVDDKQARRLLRRTVAARRRLADTEDALARLAAGRFGTCEQCGGLIPVALLAAAPESRYCTDCAADALGTDTRPTASAPARVGAHAGHRR
jgi:RNA polymerase-binding transcription factor DksA